MELYIAVIGIGLIAGLNVIAWSILNETIREVTVYFCILVEAEHKKTRKETQEIKTRLTQVRKDLNTLEKRKPIDKRLAKVK